MKICIDLRAVWKLLFLQKKKKSDISALLFSQKKDKNEASVQNVPCEEQTFWLGRV